MPHLFSGLNQKRQGGKITNGTILAGNPKTKGSTSRIVSNCQSTSANPSECISQIFAKTNPSNTLSSTGILFDKSTFDDLFDIYGSGMRPLIKPIDTNIYKKLPAPIITALNVAADRWSKFLSFQPSMVNLIRSFSSQVFGGSMKNWKGIILGSFGMKEPEPPVDDEPPPLASCGGIYIDGLQTTMIYSFRLNINKNWLDYDNSQEVSQEYLNTLITHELGHALGFPIQKSYPNGIPNNNNDNELLPNTFEGALANYETNPPSYNKFYFPKAIEAYNSMEGLVDITNVVTPQNDFLPLTNDGKDGPHLRISTIYKLEDGAINPLKFYRGFFNEIMIPYIEENKHLYI